MCLEYAMEGTFSTKSDVYSFGVLLLEIITGRKNTSFYDDELPLNLVGHVWKISFGKFVFGMILFIYNLNKYLQVWELWKDEKYFELVDPSLNDLFDHEEVHRCIHIGLLCVERYANDRPPMCDIITMLTSKNEVVSLPQRPAFYVQRYMYTKNLSSLEMCSSSTVEITASTAEMTAST